METRDSAPSLDDVRLTILRQHTQLAQLLDELELHAQAVLKDPGAPEQKALSDALESFHARLMKPLDYEETHLTSWFPGERGESLFGDHRVQRSRSRGLVHDREVFGDPRTLAHEALAQVHSVRKDITDEESALRALH